MSGLPPRLRRPGVPIPWWTGVVVGVTSIAVVGVVLARTLERDLWASTVRQMWDQPGEVVVALSFFAGAFVLRAIAWRAVLPQLGFGHSLAAIHLSLGANHVLPLRLGEGARVLSVVRRVGVPFDVAAASTITLRAADMVAVVLLGLLAGPAAFLSLVGGLGLAIFVVLMLVAVWSWRWLASLVTRRADAKLPGAMALGASVAAWLAESVLVWFAARWAGLDVVWIDIHTALGEYGTGQCIVEVPAGSPAETRATALWGRRVGIGCRCRAEQYLF